VRILVASDVWFPDFAGGSARVAAETARRLAARGHELTVLARSSPAAPRVAVEDGPRVLRTLSRTRVPTSFTDVVETARHARRLRGERFDVAVGHQPTTAAGLAAASLGASVTAVYHASAAREARLLAERLPPGPARVAARGLEPWLASVERYAFSRASSVLALSRYSASLLEADHPGAQVRVVRGGVDVERFHPGDGGPAAARRRLGIDVERPLLLVVRRLAHRLGIEDVLEAVRRLDRQDVQVALVGTGPLAARLEQLVGGLGLAGQVRFVGRPEEDALAEWYRAADVFVLPPARHEGFGMATVEALASGTPAVGAPRGATPELLRDLDPLLVAGDASPAALAAAVRRALDESGPDLRARCRAYACERFAWDRVIEDWEAALADTASPSARAA
jgi:glycosyltransferase involved in cell wall biosynthesis